MHASMHWIRGTARRGSGRAARAVGGAAAAPDCKGCCGAGCGLRLGGQLGAHEGCRGRQGAGVRRAGVAWAPRPLPPGCGAMCVPDGALPTNAAFPTWPHLQSGAHGHACCWRGVLGWERLRCWTPGQSPCRQLSTAKMRRQAGMRAGIRRDIVLTLASNPAEWHMQGALHPPQLLLCWTSPGNPQRRDGSGGRHHAGALPCAAAEQRGEALCWAGAPVLRIRHMCRLMNGPVAPAAGQELLRQQAGARPASAGRGAAAGGHCVRR